MTHKYYLLIWLEFTLISTFILLKNDFFQQERKAQQK